MHSDYILRLYSGTGTVAVEDTTRDSYQFRREHDSANFGLYEYSETCL